MKARWLDTIERRPWALAAIGSLGTTLLVPSAFALLAPPELLDAAVTLGDRRLALAVLALFAICTSMFRLLFHRRHSAEEELDADVGRGARVEMNGAGAAHAGREAFAPEEARSYLR